MNLVIIGTGYVGLVTGACFAEIGHQVVCVDKDQRKVEELRRLNISIYEPGLQQLVQQNVEAGRLIFQSEVDGSIAQADAVFISVGTPMSRRGDGYADLTYVYAAASELAPKLGGYTVVVGKSTVPVGTARQVYRIIKSVNPQAQFDVVSNPEFLSQGAAINDFLQPDRVVVGSESERATRVMEEIYGPVCTAERPMITTSLESAELTKYAANVFLATKLGFVNELANLCEAVGADVVDVTHGIGLDRRIGSKYLNPGPGYGGSCFPKDTRALLRTAQEHGVSFRIVEAVAGVNQAQKARMVDKICRSMGGSVDGKVVGVLGLSFKPETDDIRYSPAATIISRLLELGARVKGYDPAATDAMAANLPGFEPAETMYDAADGADCLVVITEWNQFRDIDWEHLKRVMRGLVVVDLRNIYDPAVARIHGFKYSSVGRC